MTNRAAALLVLPLLAVVVGCGAVEDVAGEVAGEVASQAGRAAAAEVKQQICAPVQDGEISAQDRAVLSGLVAAAEAAGVSNEITSVVEEIVSSGSVVAGSSVAELREACA